VAGAGYGGGVAGSPMKRGELVMNNKCKDCERTKEENRRLESIISSLMAAIAGVAVQDVGKKVYDKLLESTFQISVASKGAADVLKLPPRP
jgi:hypothetical protein